MLVLGGLLFILIGLLNQIWSWDFDLVWQVLIGDLIALIGEFVTGCIVNLWLGWTSMPTIRLAMDSACVACHYS